MPMIDVNFGDVSEHYPTIAPGVYEATVVGTPEIKEIETSKGKMTVLDVALQITAADNEEHEESVGLKLNDRLWLNDKGFRKVKRLALSAGLDADGPLDTDDLAGQTVRIRTKTREYKVDGEDEPRKAVDVSDYLID